MEKRQVLERQEGEQRKSALRPEAPQRPEKSASKQVPVIEVLDDQKKDKSPARKDEGKSEGSQRDPKAEKGKGKGKWWSHRKKKRKGKGKGKGK